MYTATQNAKNEYLYFEKKNKFKSTNITAGAIIVIKYR